MTLAAWFYRIKEWLIFLNFLTTDFYVAIHWLENYEQSPVSFWNNAIFAKKFDQKIF